jgi:hypothetical protein
MTFENWRWIGACATGSSHVRGGTACQDRAGCVEIDEADSLVAVVSDGAGSAEFSAIGSRIVVNGFIRHATAHLKSARSFEDVPQTLIFDWLDDIRERIYLAAAQRGTQPREMAATLVGAVISAHNATIIHVGDGSVALRSRNSSEWVVPSWPSHGEYASTTYFVTDDPQPNLKVTTVEGCFCEAAIFSDGLERLALDFTKKTAYAPFLDSKFQLLTSLPAGRDRPLSLGLRRYLDSVPILERTDDDKSLILARKIVEP